MLDKQNKMDVGKTYVYEIKNPRPPPLIGFKYITTCMMLTSDIGFELRAISSFRKLNRFRYRTAISEISFMNFFQTLIGENVHHFCLLILNEHLYYIQKS